MAGSNVYINEAPNFPMEAGEDISAGEIVCIAAADGLVYLADASDSLLRPAIGFAETDTDDGEMVSVKGAGQLTGATGLTPGATLYLSETAGAITHTAPTGSFVQSVGIAKTDTELIIRLDAGQSWYGY